MSDLILEADNIDNVPLPEHTTKLVGHKNAFMSLTKQAAAGKLPGAILLHGPRGIGKATFAFSFARKLLHLSGNEAQEIVTAQVASGAHPNLFILRRKPHDKRKGFYSVIRVEDVREMQRRMRQTPGTAGYRICIVDAIDDCNANAANALLKILEEPPVDTLFILVSHRSGALLPTIRSRCQAYAMRALTHSDVRHIIERVGTEQDPDILDRAIALSSGRPRRAFEAASLGGLELLGDLQNWLNNEGSRSGSIHLALAAKIVKAGEAEEAFARDILLDWIADEAARCATANVIERNRLATITNLWDKAREMFVEADAYNLDKKQTLISIFDALLQYYAIGAPKS